MSDNLTFAELEAQHVELLPARTVLSLFVGSGGKPGANGSQHNGSGASQAVVVTPNSYSSSSNGIAHGGTGGSTR
jgi:hypothetical protein